MIDTLSVDGPTNGGFSDFNSVYAALDPSTHRIYVAIGINNTVAAFEGIGSDVSLAVTGPSSAADEASFTEQVTVTNHGLLTAAQVTTALIVPPGLTVTSAPGTSSGSQANPLQWTDTTLAPGTSVTHSVQLTVAATAHASVALGGAAIPASGFDPDATNNVAINSIRLG